MVLLTITELDGVLILCIAIVVILLLGIGRHWFP